MTLRARPLVVVSVTKKPDGRLMLNYSRPETGGAALFEWRNTKANTISNLKPAA